MRKQKTSVVANTTGKNGIVVQQIIAVCPCTAKTSLLCAASGTHGKENSHDNV
jgi:hypothetical protein